MIVCSVLFSVAQLDKSMLIFSHSLSRFFAWQSFKLQMRDQHDEMMDIPSQNNINVQHQQIALVPDIAWIPCTILKWYWNNTNTVFCGENSFGMTIEFYLVHAYLTQIICIAYQQLMPTYFMYDLAAVVINGQIKRQ
eukprot:780698_1